MTPVAEPFELQVLFGKVSSVSLCKSASSKMPWRPPATGGAGDKGAPPRFEQRPTAYWPSTSCRCVEVTKDALPLPTRHCQYRQIIEDREHSNFFVTVDDTARLLHFNSTLTNWSTVGLFTYISISARASLVPPKEL